MKTAHTPGPWKIEETRANSAFVDVVGEDGWLVAEIEPNNPDAEANARLIAASPALFDLLKEVLAQSGCDGDLCAYEWHEKARRLLNEITEGNP